MVALEILQGFYAGGQPSRFPGSLYHDLLVLTRAVATMNGQIRPVDRLTVRPQSRHQSRFPASVGGLSVRVSSFR